jgi:predicted GIY-YIG superfamily endonuclease
LLDTNGTWVAFWAYILKCADGRYYTGQTDHLEQRIAQHNTGGYCDFTSRRRPVILVWSQGFPTRLEALEAERRIKPWARAKKEALISGDWAALSHFSKPPKERPSTSLGTNGESASKLPFVSSEVETPESRGGCAKREPFVSSEVETPHDGYRRAK